MKGRLSKDEKKDEAYTPPYTKACALAFDLNCQDPYII